MINLRGLLFVLLFTLAFVSVAYGHDHGRTDPAWEALTPEVKQWYKTLMRPDMPTLSCCGESDAYWCDDYYARDGKAYCRITDDRDDAQFARPHVPVGTEIEIPPEKLKHDRGNPTGHSIIFLRAVSGWTMVFCYVQSSGS